MKDEPKRTQKSSSKSKIKKKDLLKKDEEDRKQVQQITLHQS